MSHNRRGISQLNERLEACQESLFQGAYWPCHICSMEGVVPCLLHGVCRPMSAPFSSLAMPYLLHGVSCHICSMDVSCHVYCIECVVPYLLYIVPWPAISAPWSLSCHICSMECVVPYLLCRMCRAISAPFSFLAMPYLLHGVCRAISAPWIVSCHICSTECLVSCLLYRVCCAISALYSVSCHICSI
jgi:hypothetical protein